MENQTGAGEHRKGMTMNEQLEIAEQHLGFASDDLREALHEASAVEALILLKIIGPVNEARNEVAALRAARKDGAK